MRARIRARFAELHHEREQLETQLTTLAKTTPQAADPALLDELPLAGDILPGLPPALKARLLAAFDLQVLWNKPGQQATVFAEITEATLQALPGILDPGQDGYHDTGTDAAPEPVPAPMWDLANTDRDRRAPHSLNLANLIRDRYGGKCPDFHGVPERPGTQAAPGAPSPGRGQAVRP